MTIPAAGVTHSGRKPLPGWAIDLATEGVKGPSLTRSTLTREVRRLMMSAQQHGWEWPHVHALLTDTRRYALAAQIANGKYDTRQAGARVRRQTTLRERERFLRLHWDETEKITSARPPWSRDDALDFIEEVRESLEASDLPATHRAVMEVVIELAFQHGTSRPAVPVMVVCARTGLTRSTAYRVLMRLCDDGDWLTLAVRGDRYRGKANLYNLAPALARTYTGASPPASHPLPVSHLPISHPEEADMATATFELTKDELAVVLRMRAAAQEAAVLAGEVATGERASGNVTPIRPRSETR